MKMPVILSNFIIVFLKINKSIIQQIYIFCKQTIKNIAYGPSKIKKMQNTHAKKIFRHSFETF
ncbi:hypothetical protein HJ01_02727 [Flavobacterium frigoris PS1]|uniref:Uncharacterized protein n=1 Tax=Flavobacterium frigoris (strain PS1) TaxID=1086011 RepID=H7FU06_FLAFP|nr:hypothetical protein HJ01_02727 [Flavobacterium frigoris PS1]